MSCQSHDSASGHAHLTNDAAPATHVCLSGWNCGLFMMSSLGRMWMKTLFTQGAILCVCGERKCTFSTTTVTAMLEEKERKKEKKKEGRKEGEPISSLFNSKTDGRTRTALPWKLYQEMELASSY